MIKYQNSVGFWRHNEIEALSMMPRFHRQPYDPEEVAEWNNQAERLEKLLLIKKAVYTRYVRIRDSTTH